MKKLPIIKIEVLDQRGFPIIIYDMEKGEIDKETLSSEKKLLKSGLLVAAIQALSEGENLTNIVVAEKEKYLLLRRDRFLLVLTLSPEANPRSEKLQLFSRALLYGVIELHKRLNIDPADMFLQDYIKIIEKPFKDLVKKILNKLGI